MARVTLFGNEITEEGVPPVCMRCGEPATVWPAKVFRWNPGWVYILLLLGLLPFLIVALLTSWSRTVRTPFCDRHRGYWRFRTFYVLGGLFVLAAATVGIVLAMGDRVPTPPWSGTAWIALGVAALVWLFSAALLLSSTIRPAEITEEDITLLGVSPEFVSAVQQLRQGQLAHDIAPGEQPKKWPHNQRGEFYED